MRYKSSHPSIRLSGGEGHSIQCDSVAGWSGVRFPIVVNGLKHCTRLKLGDEWNEFSEKTGLTISIPRIDSRIGLRRSIL
jgi:hypothetical protein